MAQFIVYDHTLGGETARPVLRWGDAPADMIAAQASAANETSVSVNWNPPSDPLDFGIAYDEVAETVVLIGIPEPDPPAISAQQAAEVHQRVNAELRASDWTQMPDATFGTGSKADWDSFRAALRAVPAQGGFPDSVTWPVPPASFDEIQ